jgi:hypothetical protein
MGIVYSVVNTVMPIDMSIQFESGLVSPDDSIKERVVVSNHVQKDLSKFTARGGTLTLTLKKIKV